MAEPERRRRRRRGLSATEPTEPTGQEELPPGTATDPLPGTAGVAEATLAGITPWAGPPPDGAVRGGAARPQPARTPPVPIEVDGAAVGPRAETTPVQDPEPPPPTAARPLPEERETERGLRGLVGSGSSQVSPGAALRARDAARPTDAEVAAAERDLVIIRRNWVPREGLPGRS